MAIIKTVNGITLANVKTFNGLASASVKTINGQDSVVSASPTLRISQTVENDNISAQPCCQGVRYSDLSGGAITSIEFLGRAISTDQSCTIQLRTANNGGGSLLSTSDATSVLVNGGTNAWYSFTWGTPYTPSQDFFITIVSGSAGTILARIDYSDGTKYATTSYCASEGATSYSVADMAFKVYAQ